MSKPNVFKPNPHWKRLELYLVIHVWYEQNNSSGGRLHLLKDNTYHILTHLPYKLLPSPLPLNILLIKGDVAKTFKSLLDPETQEMCMPNPQ